MSQIRTSLLAAAVTGAVLAPAAVAQGAPTPLSVEQAPTRVAAWNGTVMWSHFDPGTKTYSLVKSVDGGAPTPVAVAPRSGGPFDIDLGTDHFGATAAVYSRNGDIYRLNLATGLEKRVNRASSVGRVERDPSIQHGLVAFLRRSHGQDELRLGSTTGSGTDSILLVRKRRIVSAEIGANHVAYLTTGPGPISAEGTTFVRIRNFRTGADRQVYKAVSGGANFANVTRPTYISKPEGFLWARTNLGSGAGNRFVRYTLRGSKLTYAKGSPRYSSTAWAGNALGVATASSLTGEESQGACNDAGINYCTVGLSGPLTFNLKP